MSGDLSAGESGSRVFYVKTGISHRNFNIGACDYSWGGLSGPRYALCGGCCYDGVYCGWLYLAVYYVPERTYWDVGACIVIMSDVM